MDYLNAKNAKGATSTRVPIMGHPVYQLEDLLRCREGLLLGSGVENGKIYKMLMSHACIEDLKTALTMFDYVEVGYLLFGEGEKMGMEDFYEK